MTSIKYDHVAPAFRDMVEKSDEERLTSLSDDCWVDYDRGTTVLRLIDRCRRTRGRIRPQSLLVYGESGVGKSAIRRKYQEDNMPPEKRELGNRQMSVVSFQMPPRPEEDTFFCALIASMGGPSENYTRTRTPRDAAVELLFQNQCEILLVDEIQFVLSGTARQQRIFLNNIRWLSNELQQPIVCFGNETAPAAFSSDTQIARRFRYIQLANWHSDLAGFKLFVSGIQRSLPLRKRGQLEDSAALNLLLERSGGITSDLLNIIEEAAEIAIESGEECITIEMLRDIWTGDMRE